MTDALFGRDCEAVRAPQRGSGAFGRGFEEEALGQLADSSDYRQQGVLEFHCPAAVFHLNRMGLSDCLNTGCRCSSCEVHNPEKPYIANATPSEKRLDKLTGGVVEWEAKQYTVGPTIRTS